MIGRISGQYNTEALNRKKSRQSVNYNSSSSYESDNANISSFGALLSKLSSEFKNIPEVRDDMVASLKSQIETGTYNPPLDKLADRLYIAGMLDMTEA